MALVDVYWRSNTCGEKRSSTTTLHSAARSILPLPPSVKLDVVV